MPGLHLLHACLPLALSHSIRERQCMETHSPRRVCLEHSLFGEKWDYTLLRCKEVLLCSPSVGRGEPRPHACQRVETWKGRPIVVFPWCHQARQSGLSSSPALPVQLSEHTLLHCRGPCLPWLKGLRFLAHWHINSDSRTMHSLGGSGD